MTGLNDVAQWLLGGGGEVLRFALYFLVAWMLIGALPRMRRDAAAKVPQVRSTARDRMKGYRDSGRRKPAEWWGWTAAWGTLSLGMAAAGFGRYMITSAWHGWGDHRRRVKALRSRAVTVRPPWRRPEPAAPPEGGDDGGPAGPPDGGSPGTAPAEPPRATAPAAGAVPGWDDPLPGPPQPAPASPAAPAETPGWDDPLPGAPEPAFTAGPNVIPFSPRNPPAGQTEGEKHVAAEISNLEAAEQVVAEMQRRAQQELDAATAEKAKAEQAMKDAEQHANDLAAAGVKGPVMEAFTTYYEAMQRAEAAAISKAVAAEGALSAANAARGALMAHRDAADRLAATGGAARSTQWYGQAG